MSRSHLLYYLKQFLYGAAMGAANTVPGVSAGTMALIFNIYEKLLDSIKAFAQADFWRALVGLRLRDAWAIVNGGFLLSLGVGVLLALLVVAYWLERLLESHPSLVWAFFFGLILASLWSVGRRVRQWSLTTITVLSLGALAAFFLVSLTPAQTPNSWWFLLLAGALAVCALILPGISGALVLVLLGKYEFVVAAVNARDFLSLAILALGGIIGILGFAQILSYLFKHYYNLTLALLTGFILGSLRKVWPWQVLEGEFSRNVLPVWMVNGAFNGEIIWALLLALFAFGLVVVVDIQGSDTA